MQEFFELPAAQIRTLEAQNKAYDDALSPYATKYSDAVYLTPLKGESPLRPSFSRDVDFILNSPFYNRYTDKTQVFSFYKNDDLTRRALHVQLVSRIARNIGRALRLNCDLIEAIALAHDMGHTPFGHRGEVFLSENYHAHTGRYFHHNVHSARIFRYIFDCRISLQTLSGILAHNGERPAARFEPDPLSAFSAFDEILERCYTDKDYNTALLPNTLEGCVVRLADMIAYVGKDRQDLYRSGLVTEKSFSEKSVIGTKNWEMIGNLSANIIKNSMEKPALSMDEAVFEDMRRVIGENYEVIYGNKDLNRPYEAAVRPLMKGLYERLLDDAERRDKTSPIFRHYLSDRIVGKHYFDEKGEFVSEPNEAVTDFIASMTDDYFIDVCKYLHIDDGLTSETDTLYHEYF